MVMTDSSMADSNKSLEMNALALKYLHDDQLTELAQLTVHNKTRDIRHTETSLLRQVWQEEKKDERLNTMKLKPIYWGRVITPKHILGTGHISVKSGGFFLQSIVMSSPEG